MLYYVSISSTGDLRIFGGKKRKIDTHRTVLHKRTRRPGSYPKAVDIDIYSTVHTDTELTNQLILISKVLYLQIHFLDYWSFHCRVFFVFAVWMIS
jgi:hypothetical protein